MHIANVNSPRDVTPSPILQGENFEDPPQGLFLQLVGDLLHSILCVTTRSGRSVLILTGGT